MIVRYERLAELVQAIRQQPGQRAGDYADQLRVDRRRLQRWLAMLEALGVHLSEDDAGGLYYVRGAEQLDASHRTWYSEGIDHDD